MFLRKAMRYYRLWIYTCNAVLLASVVVFLGVSAGVVSHPYLALVPTPAPYHPSLLYGYVALLLQAGVVQAVGCLGAIRLCQRLLSAYWLLLLFLLLGDLLVGLVWLVRFSHLTADGVTPFLSDTIKHQYGRDPEIRHVWDALQARHECCGARGAIDYRNVTAFLPDSCCHLSASYAMRHGSVQGTSHLFQYISHRQPPPPPPSSVNGGGGGAPSHNVTKGRPPQPLSPPPLANMSCRESSEAPWVRPCAAYVIKWFTDSTETLMIFGFCVITFVKLCFVGILRFEIQEMIQKIKLIQGEAAGGVTPNPELAAALGMDCPPERKAPATAEDGLLIHHGEDQDLLKDTPPNNAFRHNHISAANTQQHHHHHHHHHQTNIDGGGDSDTNSSCALIAADTPVRHPPPPLPPPLHAPPPPPPPATAKRRHNGNNNNEVVAADLRHLGHIRQTQI